MSPKRYADVFTLVPENVALFNTKVTVNCVPKRYTDVFTLIPKNVALFNTRVAVNSVPRKVC